MSPVAAPSRLRPAADQRVERLSAVSAARVLEPDEAVPGEVGPGQLVPVELLSVAPLGLDLTPEQHHRLAREEVASVLLTGVRFESVLTVGFSLEVLRRADLLDPRVTYILHELGEETRHSRLFLRVVGQLAPEARHPALDRLPLVNRIIRAVVTQPSLFVVLVLTGEEIPDLLLKRVVDHPDADPFIRAVSRYHRQEEARHLSFARLLLPELWEASSRVDRFLVRHAAPHLVRLVFDMMVHPGVYGTVGLPTWATWKRVRRSPERVALRHEGVRPILRALEEAGAVAPGRVPRAWRRVAGVDRHGRPVDPTAEERGGEAR